MKTDVYFRFFGCHNNNRSYIVMSSTTVQRQNAYHGTTGSHNEPSPQKNTFRWRRTQNRLQKERRKKYECSTLLLLRKQVHMLVKRFNVYSRNISGQANFIDGGFLLN